MMTWLFANAGLFAVYSRPPTPGEFSSDAESMSITGAPSKAVIACSFLFVARWDSPMKIARITLIANHVITVTRLLGVQCHWYTHLNYIHFVFVEKLSHWRHLWTGHSISLLPTSFRRLSPTLPGRFTLSSVSSALRCFSMSSSCFRRLPASLWRRSRPCSLITAPVQRNTSGHWHGRRILMMEACRLTKKNWDRGYRIQVEVRLRLSLRLTRLSN